MTKIYVTADWLKKLQDELEFLKNGKRVEIAEKLKEAISFWDLSENSEYEDARNEQSQVEIRISDLEEQLKNIELIDEDDNNKDANRVNMWDVVTLLDLEDDEEQDYKIVGSTESDILAELPKISNESPVWKAILGKKVWDKVKVKSQAGISEYKILKIS